MSNNKERIYKIKRKVSMICNGDDCISLDNNRTFYMFQMFSLLEMHLDLKHLCYLNI